MSARWTLACIFLAISSASASAADVETRVFAVQIDGKPAGEFRLTVRTATDGGETVSATAAVQVRQLIGGYRYSYRGMEVWKNGRLRQFDAASDDNGKKHSVAAIATETSLRVTVDGITRSVRPDVWPTTYWRMPAGAKAGQTIALLDTDTGEEQTAKVDAIGSAKITVIDKIAECTRIAVTGPAAGTLWYDGRGRLVGQETTEDGHTTVLTLREIQH